MTGLALFYLAFFGDSLLRRMLTYGIVLYGAEALGGADWSGLLYFALVVPYLGSVHAGIVIDRVHKRTILLLATTATLLLMAGLAWTARAAVPGGAPVLALVLVYGIVSAIAYPAFFAALPLATGDRSPRATVFMNILAMACYVTAPLAVGLMRSVATWPAFFAALTLLAAGSGAVLWTARVRSEPPARPDPARSGARELLEYCREHGMLGAVLIATVLYTGLIVGPVEVLLPLFADESLQLGPGAAGLFLAAGGAGTVIGAIAALSIVGGVRIGWWLCGLGVGSGVLLGVMTSAPMAARAPLFFVFGAAAGLFSSLGLAGAQACASNRIRGRVVGLFTVAAGAPPAVGGALAGWVADTLGPTAALQAVPAVASLAFAALFAAAPALRLRTPALTPLADRGNVPVFGDLSGR